MFYLVFILRRQIFVAVSLFNRIPIIQLLCIFLLNLFMMIYQGNNRPLDNRQKNRIEFSNEIFIAASTIHLVFFTDWIPDKEMQYSLGWSMLGIISMCMFYNLSYVFYYGFKSLYLMAVKYYRLLKFKINQLSGRLPNNTSIKKALHQLKDSEPSPDDDDSSSNSTDAVTD